MDFSVLDGLDEMKQYGLLTKKMLWLFDCAEEALARGDRAACVRYRVDMQTVAAETLRRAGAFEAAEEGQDA